MLNLSASACQKERHKHYSFRDLRDAVKSLIRDGDRRPEITIGNREADVVTSKSLISGYG